jgi:hypothetical protein
VPVPCSPGRANCAFLAFDGVERLILLVDHRVAATLGDVQIRMVAIPRWSYQYAITIILRLSSPLHGRWATRYGSPRHIPTGPGMSHCATLKPSGPALPAAASVGLMSGVRSQLRPELPDLSLSLHGSSETCTTPSSPSPATVRIARSTSPRPNA